MHKLSDGAWGVSGVGGPARLPGVWDQPTLTGPRIIEAGGHEYRVPESAKVTTVNASRGVVFVHVEVGSKKYLLAEGLQQVAEQIVPPALRGHP